MSREHVESPAQLFTLLLSSRRIYGEPHETVTKPYQQAGSSSSEVVWLKLSSQQ